MTMNLHDYPDVLLVKDAMRILRIGRKGVYKLIRENEIKARLIAGSYHIQKKSVADFIACLEHSA